MASAQSPPKLLLSQSAPAKVDMFTFMNMDEGKHDTNEHIKVKVQMFTFMNIDEGMNIDECKHDTTSWEWCQIHPLCLGYDAMADWARTRNDTFSKIGHGVFINMVTC